MCNNFKSELSSENKSIFYLGGGEGGVAAYLKTVINYHFYTSVTKMSRFGFIFFKHKHFKVKE